MLNVDDFQLRYTQQILTSPSWITAYVNTGTEPYQKPKYSTTPDNMPNSRMKTKKLYLGKTS